jgi:DNA-binding Xre family transcriptional regulator
MMMKTVDGIRKGLSPARRRKIEARTNQLIAEEMTRQQLRRARRRTQVSLARSMGITQDAVSRLEKRTDILLSTLSHYVEAMGGRLSLVAEFPDSNPVILSGIGDSGPDPKPGRRKRPRPHETESKAQ